MITLRPHRPDPHVLYLQRLLNEWLSHEPGSEVLVEDCDFGQRTEAALRRFQSSYTGTGGRLTVDGVAGTNTWRALGLQTEIDYAVPRVGQSTGMSCWVVAAGLATGRMTSAIPGLAQVAPNNDPNGGGGGLEPSLNNLDRYAASLQMHLHPQLPGEIEEFAHLLRRGPAGIAPPAAAMQASSASRSAVAPKADSRAATSSRVLHSSNATPRRDGETRRRL